MPALSTTRIPTVARRVIVFFLLLQLATGICISTTCFAHCMPCSSDVPIASASLQVRPYPPNPVWPDLAFFYFFLSTQLLCGICPTYQFFSSPATSRLLFFEL
ncbi:hypothetical protein GGR57DRAFT_479509 [Xylariaceae sp. FL1272]|nr:hypothetical protein GGR57DRAFT_479509 [Xylariaceae sp. FL1272]